MYSQLEYACREARHQSCDNNFQTLFVIKDPSYGASIYFPFAILDSCEIEMGGQGYEKNIVAVYCDGYSEF